MPTVADAKRIRGVVPLVVSGADGASAPAQRLFGPGCMRIERTEQRCVSPPPTRRSGLQELPVPPPVFLLVGGHGLLVAQVGRV